MTRVVLKNILAECKCIEYYLPSIESEISVEVAEEIRKRLHAIEKLATFQEDSEKQALLYATGAFPVVSSEPDSE
jgi:hypothetical protein